MDPSSRYRIRMIRALPIRLTARPPASAAVVRRVIESTHVGVASRVRD